MKKYVIAILFAAASLAAVCQNATLPATQTFTGTDTFSTNPTYLLNALTQTGPVYNVNHSAYAGNINAAIAAAAANGGGIVFFPNGTYTAPSPSGFKMLSNVRVVCESWNAVLQRPASDTTGINVIEFATGVNSASIENCTLDGNEANETTDNSAVINFDGTASNNLVLHNQIQNSFGNGLNAGNHTGTGNVVRDNVFQNFGYQPMGYANHAPGHIANSTSVSNKWLFDNNTFSDWGGGYAIMLVYSDENVIVNNRFNGTVRIGTVQTNGTTTATWVSGAYFTGLRAGHRINIQNKGAFGIVSVSGTPATTLILSVAAGATTGEYNAGDADDVNLDACHRNVIANNTMNGGADAGVAIDGDIGSGSESADNIVIGNSIVNQSSAGILLSGQTGEGNVVRNLVIGNNLRANNAGLLALNGTSTPLGGIYLTGVNTMANMIGTNTETDVAGGAAVQEYGVAIAATVPANSNQVAPQLMSGNINNSVYNGNGADTYYISQSNFTVQNSSDLPASILIDSGATAGQTAGYQFNDRGTLKWTLQKTAGNNFILRDEANAGAYRINATAGGQISINAIGSSSVAFNTVANQGSGGVSFYDGGPGPSVVATVDNTGKGAFNGGVAAGGGSNVVYRCTTAGALPIGALTINTANCGASVATALTLN